MLPQKLPQHLAICEPTADYSARKAISPTPHRCPEWLWQPTAAACLGVGWQMYRTGRPLRRSAMARWRAVNSSCMGISVVRPLAVAHGGHSNRRAKGHQTYGVGRHVEPTESGAVSGRPDAMKTE